MKHDLHASPDRITRRKLSDQVFDRLREMMASGELPAGAPMPSERDLMERFGVGRPAVREALQHMQTMGLITISHGERSRVNELSAGSVLERVDDVARMLLSSEPEHLEHLKQARRMFECGLVRVAAENATAQDVRDLRELVIGSFELFSNQTALRTNDSMRLLTFVTVVTGVIFVVCVLLFRRGIVGEIAARLKPRG